MEIREKTINKRKWQLVNDCWQTRSSWGHETAIIKNGLELIRYKCRYYNRTWEEYTYQSCMLWAIEELKKQKLDSYIEDYKTEKGIARFKKEEKEKVITEFNKTEIARDLNKLRDAVKTKTFR